MGLIIPVSRECFIEVYVHSHISINHKQTGFLSCFYVETEYKTRSYDLRNSSVDVGCCPLELPQVLHIVVLLILSII